MRSSTDPYVICPGYEQIAEAAVVKSQVEIARSRNSELLKPRT